MTAAVAVCVCYVRSVNTIASYIPAGICSRLFLTVFVADVFLPAIVADVCYRFPPLVFAVLCISVHYHVILLSR